MPEGEGAHVTFCRAMVGNWLSRLAVLVLWHAQAGCNCPYSGSTGALHCWMVFDNVRLLNLVACCSCHQGHFPCREDCPAGKREMGSASLPLAGGTVPQVCPSHSFSPFGTKSKASGVLKDRTRGCFYGSVLAFFSQGFPFKNSKNDD